MDHASPMFSLFSLFAVTHFSSVLLCDYVLTKEQREQKKKKKTPPQKYQDYLHQRRERNQCEDWKNELRQK